MTMPIPSSRANAARSSRSACGCKGEIARLLAVLLSAASFLTLCHVSVSIAQETSAPAIDEGEAIAWKHAQLTEIQPRLAAASDPAMKTEWQARLDWLQSWQPGQMDRLDAFSSQRQELIREPELQRLQGHLTEAGTSQLQRAIRLQQGIQQLDAIDVRKANLRNTVELSDAYIETLQSLRGEAVDDATRRRLKWALAYARYRQARALAYQELPDVLEEHPVDDPAALDRRLRQVHQALQSQFETSRPEFVLLDVRMLRRDEKFATALQRLEQHRATIEGKWYLKKRRDLLEKLGWIYPWKEAAAIYDASGLNPDAEEDA